MAKFIPYKFMNWYYVQYSQYGDRGVFNITQRPQLSTSTSQPSIELHQPRTASPASQEEPSTAAGESKKERSRLLVVRFPLQILAGITTSETLKGNGTRHGRGTHVKKNRLQTPVFEDIHTCQK